MPVKIEKRYTKISVGIVLQESPGISDKIDTLHTYQHFSFSFFLLFFLKLVTNFEANEFSRQTAHILMI